MKYVYCGPATNLVRFGSVGTGDVLELTADEIASITADTRFFALPAPSADKAEIINVGNLTITNAMTGKLIRSNHTAAVQYTLPASPDPGFNVEIIHADFSAGDDITVDPGLNTISGVTGAFTLTADTSRKGFYWNGSTYVRF